MKPDWKLTAAADALALILAAGLAGQARGEGGIVTDGTVGPKHTLGGAQVDIPQSLGTTVGKNVFHSFSQFNVVKDQTVTFQENAPNTLDNVISRVTGGNRSDINGTLRSTPGGHANLYLINPHGVVFGQDAKIDVPGNVHISTADELRFKDGGKFSATDPNGSSLTAAAPSAFGFMKSSAANNSLIKVDGARLEIKPGKAIDMVANSIRIENGARMQAQGRQQSTDDRYPEKTSAAGIEVRLVARRGAGELSVEPAANKAYLSLPLDKPTTSNAGKLTINNSTVDVSGNGGGRIGLWGRRVELTGKEAALAADNEGQDAAGAGGGVETLAKSISVDGGKISGGAFYEGAAGQVKLTAIRNVTVRRGAEISGLSAVKSSAKGADVTIKAGKNFSLESGSRIDIAAAGTESPKSSGGALNIHAGKELTLRNGATIDAHSILNGKAGTVELHADENLSMSDGAGVQSFAVGQSDTGSISLTAGGKVTLAGAGTGTNVEVVQSSRANVGRVRIVAGGDIEVRDGATVSGLSDSTGKAGVLSLRTQGGNLALRNGGTLSSNTTSTVGSDGGDIVIHANVLFLQSGTITANTVAPAQGGTIGLDLGGILADGNNIIFGGNVPVTQPPNLPGWNVIQAVAPNGGAGLIQSTATQLNLSGVLLGLDKSQLKAVELGKDYCARQNGSTLTRSGQGSLPSPVDDLLN